MLFCTLVISSVDTVLPVCGKVSAMAGGPMIGE